jgi:type II secretion system protein N
MSRIALKTLALPVAFGLILVFMLILFPWDSLARRIAWEVSGISGGRVTISTLAPAFSDRGPVLKALDVRIEHPAIDRIRLSELEIAPRELLGWLTGAPTLRIWTVSSLGIIDGLFALGADPSFVGEISAVELARLPLRLDPEAIQLSGQFAGEVDVALDPKGTLRGQMTFRSESLVVASGALPMPISFSRAEGAIQILDSGATRIESLDLEGDILQGTVFGEFGLVHRSQSLPIKLKATMRILDPQLRQVAMAAGIRVAPSGDFDVQIDGNLDAPIFTENQPTSAFEVSSAKAKLGRRAP